MKIDGQTIRRKFLRPELQSKLGEEGYRKTCKEHALPDNFENMDYMEFLSQRRILMAQTVRKAYQRLCE